jgi:hypothetical protein
VVSILKLVKILCLTVLLTEPVFNVKIKTKKLQQPVYALVNILHK